MGACWEFPVIAKAEFKMKHSQFVFSFLCFFIIYRAKCAYGFFNDIVNWADEKLNCRISLCCDDLEFDRYALKRDLREKVFGQHLVSSSVINSLDGHISNPNPSKALVLSFHGWAGLGKTFVSKIITKNLFKKGLESRHAKFFVASHDFPHSSLIDSYKDVIRHTVKDHVERCSRALFVFDEIDKMAIGLIDTIKPYLDHDAIFDGVDYRKAIFIFLSNTGGEAITFVTYQNWINSKPRESLTLKDFEEEITISAFNQVEGGLWRTSLIKSNVISIFVPFLPLEKKHIKLCIKNEIARRPRQNAYSLDVEAVVNQIANELSYWPEVAKIYSISGCKRVAQKVDMIITYRYDHNEL